MSRSVRTNYEKLFNVVKLPATIRLTDEQFWMLADTDPAYERKVEPYNVSPTNEDWAKYHRAKAGLLALQAYDDAHGLGDIEILMPAPRTEYRFTETNEEWLDRCRALQAERKAA